jgi:hypothetical protein
MKNDSMMLYLSIVISAAVVTGFILGVILLFTGGYQPPNLLSYAIFINLILIFWNHEVNNSRG